MHALFSFSSFHVKRKHSDEPKGGWDPILATLPWKQNEIYGDFEGKTRRTCKTRENSICPE